MCCTVRWQSASSDCLAELKARGGGMEEEKAAAEGGDEACDEACDEALAAKRQAEKDRKKKRRPTGNDEAGSKPAENDQLSAFAA